MDALQRFESQLAARVEAAATQAAVRPPAAALAALGAAPQQVGAWVTCTAAFPGCYEVVLQLALPTQSSQDNGFMQQLQQHIQAAAEQVAAERVQTGGVVGVNLHQGLPLDDWQLQQPDGVPAASLAVEAADSATSAPEESAAQPPSAAHHQACNTAGTASPLAATAPSSTTDTEPYRRAIACSAPSGVYVQPAVLSCSSPGAALTAVQLRMAGCLLHQLLHAGLCSVRVVVSSQLPTPRLLLDCAWQLPGTAERGASVTPSPAADQGAVAEEGCVQLQLPLSSVLADQQIQVLTVVLLAGGSAAAANAWERDLAVPAFNVWQMSQATADSQSGQGPSAVIAQLPLLVLPSGAASELQQLMARTASEGLPSSFAYAQLYPLLRDLGAVLCSAAGDGDAAQQALRLQVLHALSACFTEHGLQLCQQLLPAWQTLSDSSAGGASQTGLVGTGGAVAAGSSRLGAAGMVGDALSSELHSKGGAAFNGNSGGGSHPAVDLGVPGVGVTHAAARPPSAYHVGWKAMLCGFPPPVEAAYMSYKAVIMRKTDLGLMLISTVGFVAMCVKLLATLVSQGGAGADQVQAYLAVLCALFVAIHAAMRTVVWAAGVVPQLGALQQWRSAVLYGGPTLVMCIIAGCLCRGGWLGSSGHGACSRPNVVDPPHGTTPCCTPHDSWGWCAKHSMLLSGAGFAVGHCVFCSVWAAKARYFRLWVTADGCGGGYGASGNCSRFGSAHAQVFCPAHWPEGIVSVPSHVMWHTC